MYVTAYINNDEFIFIRSEAVIFHDVPYALHRMWNGWTRTVEIKNRSLSFTRRRLLVAGFQAIIYHYTRQKYAIYNTAATAVYTDGVTIGEQDCSGGKTAAVYLLI